MGIFFIESEEKDKVIFLLVPLLTFAFRIKKTAATGIKNFL
ncbi:hypothetical protein EV10_1685 [Prochlorococcus marinus str. SS51]|nr:hypothetical protein EV04_1864 [Prochlorococcus marinus str. LG]KGG24151.1 hypothetical protein EV09_0757 [Prochlorococcus marinus str. SS35]KGG31591.1 hypothetical protein EV10_1685 [Prochlorococcus marinus str. SS51]